MLRADVDASINNLVEHGHAILVGEALEGVLSARQLPHAIETGFQQQLKLGFGGLADVS